MLLSPRKFQRIWELRVGDWGPRPESGRGQRMHFLLLGQPEPPGEVGQLAAQQGQILVSWLFKWTSDGGRARVLSLCSPCAACQCRGRAWLPVNERGCSWGGCFSCSDPAGGQDGVKVSGGRGEGVRLVGKSQARTGGAGWSVGDLGRAGLGSESPSG